MSLYPTLRNGNRGAVTPAQLSRIKMQKYSQEYSTAGTALGKYTFSKTAADYVADGTLYKITCTHPINDVHYTWSVIKADNSAGIVVEDYHQGAQTLTLWFNGDTLDLEITVIG